MYPTIVASTPGCLSRDSAGSQKHLELTLVFGLRIENREIFGNFVGSASWCYTEKLQNTHPMPNVASLIAFNEPYWPIIFFVTRVFGIDADLNKNASLDTARISWNMMIFIIMGLSGLGIVN